MSATGFVLTDQLKNLGTCEVFIGSPFVSAGLTPIGFIDGSDIRVNLGERINALTTDVTGGAAHEATVTPEEPTVSFDLVLGDDALYAKIRATGLKGAGHSRRKPVATTSLVIVPHIEMTTADPPVITYATATWTPAAPKHALWLWRGYFTCGEKAYSPQSGGKTTAPVTFHGMWNKTANTPEGQKIYTIGDPAAQGVTGLAI